MSTNCAFFSLIRIWDDWHFFFRAPDVCCFADLDKRQNRDPLRMPRRDAICPERTSRLSQTLGRHPRTLVQPFSVGMTMRKAASLFRGINRNVARTSDDLAPSLLASGGQTQVRVNIK
jgi:hypothetical protein